MAARAGVVAPVIDVASSRKKDAPIRIVALARHQSSVHAVGGCPCGCAIVDKRLNLIARRHAPCATPVYVRRVMFGHEIAGRVDIARRQKRRIVFAQCRSGRTRNIERNTRSVLDRNPSASRVRIPHRVAPPEVVAVLLGLGGSHVALRPIRPVLPQLDAAERLPGNRHHERGVGKQQRAAEGRGKINRKRIRARDDVRLDECRARVVRVEDELRNRAHGKLPADRVFDRRLSRIGIRLVELRDLHGVCVFRHRTCKRGRGERGRRLPSNCHNVRRVGEQQRTAEGRSEVNGIRIRTGHDVALGEGRARVVRVKRDLRNRVRGERPADRIFDRRLARIGIRLVELRDLHGVGDFRHRIRKRRRGKRGRRHHCHDSSSYELLDVHFDYLTLNKTYSTE